MIRPIVVFISLLPTVFLTIGLTWAQQLPKEVRIGVVGAPEEPRFTEVVSGLKSGLLALGYAPPALIIHELKLARGSAQAARSAIDELLRQNVQVLFLVGSRLVKPSRAASAHIPIVFITPGDPVAAGLVASLARPGNNMTAMTFEYPELSGKRLELMRDIAPKARRVLALYDSRDASPRQGIMAARQAAAILGITLLDREVRDRDELTRVMETLAQSDAFLSIPGGFPTGHYDEITRLVNTKRLPSIFHARTAATASALASYGANDAQISREAARLVDKILKGTKAGEIPIERPTKLEFIINLKTAKQIGLTIPPNVLARADRVIR